MFWKPMKADHDVLIPWSTILYYLRLASPRQWIWIRYDGRPRWRYRRFNKTTPTHHHTNKWHHINSKNMSCNILSRVCHFLCYNFHFVCPGRWFWMIPFFKISYYLKLLWTRKWIWKRYDGKPRWRYGRFAKTTPTHHHINKRHHMHLENMSCKNRSSLCNILY